MEKWIQDLKDQLEMTQEEEIFADVEDFREECSILAENIEDRTKLGSWERRASWKLDLRNQDMKAS